MRHQRVALHKGFHVPVISAADHAHERNVQRPSPIGNHRLALANAVITEFKFAQPVISVGIDAAIVEDDVRRHVALQLVQRIVQGAEIGVIACSFGQSQVEITVSFPHWPVIFAVDRKGMDARLSGEDLRRAVTLVDIAIDNQHLTRATCLQQKLRRDGHVIEYAETRATRRVCMVASTCGVDRAACL